MWTAIVGPALEARRARLLAPSWHRGYVSPHAAVVFQT